MLVDTSTKAIISKSLASWYQECCIAELAQLNKVDDQNEKNDVDDQDVEEKCKVHVDLLLKEKQNDLEKKVLELEHEFKAQLNIAMEQLRKINDKSQENDRQLQDITTGLEKKVLQLKQELKAQVITAEDNKQKYIDCLKRNGRYYIENTQLKEEIVKLQAENRKLYLENQELIQKNRKLYEDNQYLGDFYDRYHKKKY